eukprot:CAMPEP_0119314670 /NCGR_PEP_ID=MMETSP1333-20130426/33663_1 /TAXON_ID=418940 /ORGANISM="Scyphosphaera apsteinii, Strain RCC1455" /LENGTH=107 /DNA_ID=CAMNT_0007319839 /DNA_START=215 /DNA_END=538 /DNA_ORIENTATION=+
MAPLEASNSAYVLPDIVLNERYSAAPASMSPAKPGSRLCTPQVSSISQKVLKRCTAVTRTTSFLPPDELTLKVTQSLMATSAAQPIPGRPSIVLLLLLMAWAYVGCR